MKSTQPPLPQTFTSTFSSHHKANIRRWDGNTRRVTAWDGLRKVWEPVKAPSRDSLPDMLLAQDPDLWMSDGNCLVYLYAKGQSQRGPSFRIPMQALKTAQCARLVALAAPVSDWPLLGNAKVSQFEIYLPVPTESVRQEVLRWHVATRNFFAWMCQTPLIGEHLGNALSNLLERMMSWRDISTDNVEDVLVYADHCGYSSVENCPDHALAMLHFAERFELEHVWIDAFAHCVGMNDLLAQSPEFEPIGRVTKALITRAYLEMDLHLGRATTALGTFLEDELSSAHVGLSGPARMHLDNFRSFLYSYYVAKHGYWPPPRSRTLPKSLYRSMYLEFCHLYDFLADKESSGESQLWQSSNGGICVVQNIDAFNRRQKLKPLPYPVPLIPQEKSRTDSQRSLRGFRIGSRKSGPNRAERVRESLRSATNRTEEAVFDCPLVQRYISFEDEYAAKPDAKISLADARRVRWILIYGVLQTVVSLIQAPAEVRHPEKPDYPLCVLTVGMPPWKKGVTSYGPSEKTSTLQSLKPTSVDIPSQRPTSPALSIHPDCEPVCHSQSPTSDANAFVSNIQRHDSGLGRSDSLQTFKDSSKLFALARLRLSKRNSSQNSVQRSSQCSDLVSGPTLAELAQDMSHLERSRLSTAETGVALSPSAYSQAGSPVVKEDQRGPNVLSQEPLDEHAKLVPLDDPRLSLFEKSETSSIPSLTFSLYSHEMTDPSDGETSLLPEFEPALVANSAHQKVAKRRIGVDRTPTKNLPASPGLYTLKGQSSSRSISSDNLPASVTKGYHEACRMEIMSSSSSVYSYSGER